MKKDRVFEYLEELQGKKFRLVKCRRFNQDSDVWILNEHKHSHMELIYFVDGQGEIKTGSGQERLHFYDVLIHPQNVPHRELVDLHLRQEVINLEIECLDTLENVPNTSFILKDDTGLIRSICRNIQYHAAHPDAFSGRLIEGYLSILMVYLLKSKTDHSNQETSILERVIEFVQDHYNQDLQVADLAEATHVSESYLSRVMHKGMGTTPMKYVNSVRLEIARRMLLTDASIEKIAEQAGFSEVKYFSTLFKKTIGMPPSAYRKKMRGERVR